jgi:hypothetical protein
MNARMLPPYSGGVKGAEIRCSALPLSKIASVLVGAGVPGSEKVARGGRGRAGQAGRRVDHRDSRQVALMGREVAGFGRCG